MVRARELFLLAKAVIGPDKNSKDSLMVLQLSGKASVASCQCGDMVTQVGVDALNGKGVAFVVNN